MWKGINSKYILIYVCSYIKKNKLLRLIKPNKKLKSLLEISLNDYKDFGKIVIDVFPLVTSDEDEKFINYDKKDESSYHIYLNDDIKELKYNFIVRLFADKNYISKEDNVKKIRIVIDNNIRSLKGLFKDCVCLQEVNFITFDNEQITDMSQMFEGCHSLKKLNILNINTENVRDMNYMFGKCKNLKKLDLKNFKTYNCINMRGMFFQCEALEDLNFLIFDTSNVTEIGDLFYKCISLKELNIYNADKYYDEQEIIKIKDSYPLLAEMNIPNFRMSKVKDMSFMFDRCYCLKTFHIINFDTSKVKEMNRIFLDCKQLLDFNSSKFVINQGVSAFKAFKGCSEQMISKIKDQIDYNGQELY